MAENPDRARISSVVCFTLASLFHEMIPLGLAAALAYVALFHRAGVRLAVVTFGTPLAVFLVLNAIDAAIYGVSFSPGVADVGSHYLYSLSLPGGFLAALIAPHIVRIGFVPGYDLPVWSNAAAALPALYALSVVFVILAIGAMGLVSRKMAAHSSRSAAMCATLAGGVLLALVIGFGIGRAVARGPDYVMVATWYNAMVIYLMLMLLACLARFYASRATTICISIAVCGLIVENAALVVSRLHETLAP